MEQIQQQCQMYLCDLKEVNVLIKFSKKAIGYVSVFTDLGGMFCKALDPERSYCDFYTPVYSDERLIHRMDDIGYIPSESEMIQNELFTLCRMVQRIMVMSIKD